MKSRIKKKDVKIFALGFLAAFVFNIFSNWEGNVESFEEGYTAGREFLGKTD